MRNQNQKHDNLYRQQSTPPNYQQFQRNKISQSYRSYFFRNSKQITQSSPSQSSQTDKLSKTKKQLQSTRIKCKNSNCIYYQLQLTQKNQDQSLRLENVELKKIIAQLKISQLYQIDQNKVRNLIQEIEELKIQIKNIKKINQKYKIQNDFLHRTNFQLKLEINRFRNKLDGFEQVSPSIAKQYRYISELEKQRKKVPITSRIKPQVPQHLILASKTPKQQKTIQQYGMKTSQRVYDSPLANKIIKQNQQNLSRIKSLRRIKTQNVIAQRIRSKKKQIQKQMFAQLQNNQHNQKIK